MPTRHAVVLLGEGPSDYSLDAQERKIVSCDQSDRYLPRVQAATRGVDRHARSIGEDDGGDSLKNTDAAKPLKQGIVDAVVGRAEEDKLLGILDG